MLQGYVIGGMLCPLVATGAFLLIVRNDPAFRVGYWAWQLIGGTVLFVALVTFREPVPYLIVCLLAAVRVPDLFASHYFHLKTTAPLPKSRAKTLRSLWARRMRSLTTAAKGLELYALAALSVVAILVFVYALEAGNRERLMATEARHLDSVMWLYIELHGAPLLLGLLLLLVTPWLAEHVIAFLFARSRSASARWSAPSARPSSIG